MHAPLYYFWLPAPPTTHAIEVELLSAERMRLHTPWAPPRTVGRAALAHEITRYCRIGLPEYQRRTPGDVAINVLDLACAGHDLPHCWTFCRLCGHPGAPSAMSDGWLAKGLPPQLRYYCPDCASGVTATRPWDYGTYVAPSPARR